MVDKPRRLECRKLGKPLKDWDYSSAHASASLLLGHQRKMNHSSGLAELLMQVKQCAKSLQKRKLNKVF